MGQIKRPGGTDGLGYYTAWEKSSENGCIYCGKPAFTREHVPSKAFLTRPYPQDLATVPACFECNNGFSSDEKYVSCFLDVLKESVYQGYTRRVDTSKRLSDDIDLSNLIAEQIKLIDGKVKFAVDANKLRRILLKLAQGHAGYEFDHINFDNSNITIWYEFAFNLSLDMVQEFEEIPQMDIMPEVGSRSSVTPFILQNVETGEALAFMLWNEVQEDQYRYQVFYNEAGGVSVKIVIYELLYARIDFDLS